jgi:hypothetical protein
MEYIIAISSSLDIWMIGGWNVMHGILIYDKLSLDNKVLVYPKCSNVQMFHVSFLVLSAFHV